jgi:hypothetical protein
MTPLTDEVLRQRLGVRAAAAPAISLSAIARSVAAEPRRRPVHLGWRGRAGVLGSAAAAVVVGVALLASLLVRTGPPSGASGSDGSAATSGAVASGPGSTNGASGLAVWRTLAWEKVSAKPFTSFETIVHDVIAVGDGFVAVGTTQAGETQTGHVWRSIDGRSWERLDDPAIASLTPERILVVGSTQIIIGAHFASNGDQTGAVELWHSIDGQAWTRGPDLPAFAIPSYAAAGPHGILIADVHESYLLGPDLVGWARTTTWPAGVLLGTPSWAAGRWIQPGTTGVDGASGGSQAAVWTSSDGWTWTQSAVDQPRGGMFRVLAAERGMVGIGTGDDVCLPCRRAAPDPQSITMAQAWASSDGNSWRLLSWDAPGLPIGGIANLAGIPQPMTTFAGDGRRIIVSRPVGATFDKPGTHPAFLETVDGVTWTPIMLGDVVPDEFAFTGTMVVGRKGVALLEPQGYSTFSLAPQIWWGAAGEAPDPGASTAPSFAPPSPGPSPSVDTVPRVVGCDTLGFDARRCAAVVARAREEAGNPTNVVMIVIRPAKVDTTSLGSHPLATVGLTLADGTQETVDLTCFNVVARPSSDRACDPDAQIALDGGVSHDVPCGPTPCDDNHPGATPPPSPKPAVVAASTPLVLRVFDIPIDHVGHYEILVGDATLPDGLLSERSGTLGDPRPTDYWIEEGVQIVVRPGPLCYGSHCPEIDSIYHAPFHGPEAVHVYLVFDVTELDAPGVVLEVRNLVVR